MDAHLFDITDEEKIPGQKLLTFFALTRCLYLRISFAKAVIVYGVYLCVSALILLKEN